MVDLASAERYTIAVGSTNAAFGTLGLGSAVDIWVNVAATNNLTIGAGAIIRGDACSKYVNADASVTITGDKNVVGQCSNINELGADIATASQQAANLADQYVFGDIESTKSVTISGHQAYKVGNLHLQTGEYFTVIGNSNDFAVFNISGLASIGSGAGILLEGGILAKNVIFNFLDNAGMTNFIFGGAIINGTFLSNTRSFQLGDDATLNNTRFLTNASIQGNVQTVKFGGKTTTEVPEPSTLLLMLIALSFLLFRTNSKHQ